MRRAAAAALAACLGAWAPALAAPGPGSPAVRCDPECNVRVTTVQGPANEVSLAVNPRDPDNLLAAAKDYTLGVNANACNRYQVWAGLYRSQDGGRTWSEQLLPREGPAATYRCVSDPVVTFGPDGEAYFFGLGIRAPGAARLFVARSRDGGATWGVGPEIAVPADKEWAAADPSSGRLWVTWVDVGGSFETGGAVVRAARSDDGGQSWVPVDVPGSGGDQGPSVAVDAGGRAYLAWRDLTTGAMEVASTADGGRTWTRAVAAVTAAAGDGLWQGRGYRAFSFPSLGVDTSPGPRRGTVYLAYTDLAQSVGEVRVVHSRDGGRTWSLPVTVSSPSPAGLVADDFMAALAVDPAGGVHVVWYSDADGGRGLLDVHHARSPDGESWSPPLRLTTVSSDPRFSYHQEGFRFIGDYIGVAASPLAAHAAWTDTRNGRADVYTAAVPR